MRQPGDQAQRPVLRISQVEMSRNFVVNILRMLHFSYSDSRGSLCLLCRTADISAVSHSRHSLLRYTADCVCWHTRKTLFAVWHSRRCLQRLAADVACCASRLTMPGVSHSRRRLLCDASGNVCLLFATSLDLWHSRHCLLWQIAEIV